MNRTSFFNFRSLAKLDNLWCPPHREQFDKLFATTYTLEEVVLCNLVLQFFAPETRAHSPFDRLEEGALKALMNELDSNFLVLYDRIGLSLNREFEKSKIPFFARYIKEKPPKRQESGQLRRFHPKLFWATFKNSKAGAITGARILISSQNLSTSGACLESGFVLEFRKSQDPGRTVTKIQRKFLEDLRRTARRWNRSPLLDRLFELTLEMECINWPDVDSITVRNPIKSSRPLRTALGISKNAKAQEALLISPFLSFSGIKSACSIGENVGIVSRQECIDMYLSRARTKAYVADRSLPLLSGDISILSPAIKRPLHAKILLANFETTSKALIGSSNLSEGGWGRNDELNVCMTFLGRMPKIGKVLKQLTDVRNDELYENAERSERPSDIIRRIITEWLAEWSISWRAVPGRPAHFTHLPIDILPAPFPKAPAGLEAEWKEAIGEKLVTVQCGKFTTIPEPIASSKTPLILKLEQPMDKLRPSILLRFGKFSLPVVPDYQRFGGKKVWQEFSWENMLDALLLLQRPSEFARRIRSRIGLGENSESHSSVLQFSIDRFIVSLFCEKVSGISKAQYLEQSRRIGNLLNSLSDFKRTSENLALVSSLKGLQAELKTAARVDR